MWRICASIILVGAASGEVASLRFSARVLGVSIGWIFRHDTPSRLHSGGDQSFCGRYFTFTMFFMRTFAHTYGLQTFLA